MVADPYTLAVIDFSSQSQFTDEKRIIIGTPALTGGDLLEVWRTNEIPESGKIGDIHYRSTSALIFGQLLIPSDSDSMESLTQKIYQQISQLQLELSFEKMIRVWNYLPWINRHDEGLERYQSFCVGRHQAIDTSRGYESHLPAATAVGTDDGGVLVYFLAAQGRWHADRKSTTGQRIRLSVEIRAEKPDVLKSSCKAMGRTETPLHLRHCQHTRP